MFFPDESRMVLRGPFGCLRVKSEKNHFFIKMFREFNFRPFLGLSLIRISIAVQLSYWCDLLY